MLRFSAVKQCCRAVSSTSNSRTSGRREGKRKSRSEAEARRQYMNPRRQVSARAESGAGGAGVPSARLRASMYDGRRDNRWW